MDKLVGHNANFYSPTYRPAHLENHKEKLEYFEVPVLKQKYDDTITLIIGYNKFPITQFQYKLLQNIIPNEDIIPQIKIIS